MSAAAEGCCAENRPNRLLLPLSLSEGENFYSRDCLLRAGSWELQPAKPAVPVSSSCESSCKMSVAAEGCCAENRPNRLPCPSFRLIYPPIFARRASAGSERSERRRASPTAGKIGGSHDMFGPSKARTGLMQPPILPAVRALGASEASDGAQGHKFDAKRSR